MIFDREIQSKFKLVVTIVSDLILIILNTNITIVLNNDLNYD